MFSPGTGEGAALSFKDTRTNEERQQVEFDERLFDEYGIVPGTVHERVDLIADEELGVPEEFGYHDVVMQFRARFDPGDFGSAVPNLADFGVGILSLKKLSHPRAAITSITDNDLLAQFVQDPIRIIIRHAMNRVTVIGDYHAIGTYSERITGTENLKSGNELSKTLWPVLKYLREQQTKRPGGTPPGRRIPITREIVDRPYRELWDSYRLDDVPAEHIHARITQLQIAVAIDVSLSNFEKWLRAERKVEYQYPPVIVSEV